MFCIHSLLSKDPFLYCFLLIYLRLFYYCYRYAVTEATGKPDTRFISQEPNKYFWWFICMQGSVRSFQDCNEGSFNLNIRRNFAIMEIDLGGLPWDEIAEDLEDFTGLKMENTKYTWLGRDCV